MFNFSKRRSKKPVELPTIPPAVFMYVTFTNAEEARKTIAFLIDRKLVACANVMPPHTAIFRWDGKVQAAEEIPVIFKTRQALFDKAKDAILKLHGYSCPCVIALPITRGHGPYMNWIMDNTVDPDAEVALKESPQA
jgi:periplasmic divalent cation tolerance protein